MTFTLLYWILMLLWAVFGMFGSWPAPGSPRAAWLPVGGSLLLFILLVLLGWHDFGSPIKPN